MEDRTMYHLRTIAIFAFIIGLFWLTAYGFANSRIIRILLYTVFGIVAAYYIIFMTIAEVGLCLDDKKREREKERQGGK